MDKPTMQIDDSWILNALMDSTADSIYVKDLQCRLWRVSKKMAIDLGFSDPAEIYGKTDVELFGEELGRRTMRDDLKVMETGIAQVGIIESWITRSGETNWTSTTKMPLRNDNGEVIGLLGITREVNELKNAEIESEFRATHDALTSLANRFLLMDQIKQSIFSARAYGRLFALLFIDLNGFKQINDTVGHDKGDEYLIQLARVLTKNVRLSDTVARFGGDEFVVVLNHLGHVEDALAIAQKISDAICYEVDPSTHTVTASIGVSIFPNHGEDAETLLKAADQAMYCAKSNSLNFKLAED
jgi:diguanylate cyclase (GGDEF)-like protein/PAS domain S-box-containing protein